MPKQLFWFLWIGLIAYAFLAAPPNQPHTAALIQALLIGQWQGINPLVLALFNLMGIWPITYSCLLFPDGSGQRIPAWPFALVSFAVGAFALLPYLALREAQPYWSGQKNLLLSVLEARWTGIMLTLATLGFLGYGLVAGDWSDFGQQWQSSRFIHVMSLDFCLLCLLFPVLLGDDMARRGVKSQYFWIFALVPLLGPLLYLCLRPPLPSPQASVIQPQA